MVLTLLGGEHGDRLGGLVYLQGTEDPKMTSADYAALHQQYAADRARLSRWERDLLAGAPTARIIELPCANLYNVPVKRGDVLREVRAFAATLTDR